MNIYARIRKIEDQEVFKRFFNSLLGAEYKTNFQPTKDWHDHGVDGYLKDVKTVYAVYCPKYPERKEQKQYKDKIKNDIDKLKKSIADKKLSLEVNEWCFVTPDDLTTEIICYIDNLTKPNKWKTSTLTAQILAVLFMKHPEINIDFPEITAGLQFDKMPDAYVKFVNNRGYAMLEIFNNGTEDLQDLEIYSSTDKKNWQNRNIHFLYEFDNPGRDDVHTCYNLIKGERQYIKHVPAMGGFYYKVTAVGVESRKTFYKEGFIEEIKRFSKF
ncbi:hypothetical protein A2Y83_02575 [Candidatus Falkowbacteria bacterium RBG_13_39_14]|uniref:Uncharacterized protein n=1 Tax=Candidatus Falkowbacteria bacterium RBG_13_39_14 TaxID=1797985 RepID=A0A1F5S668_9BACT|nr:MAG: hypothetical protein A2Y83_02575 [Candidatus Falkowbacteria bacterium RBG_13_39_14]